MDTDKETFLTMINWWSLLAGAAPFLVVFFLQILLDLKLAPFFVKWLSWFPVRNYFRKKPTLIKGKWEQIWSSANSPGFSRDTDRHSHPVIKQLGSYCYTEFISKEISYVVFGRVINDYFVGDWYDKKDPLGYYGAFQLRVIDSKTMRGKWVGHSKTTVEVKADEWNWSRLP